MGGPGSRKLAADARRQFSEGAPGSDRCEIHSLTRYAADGMARRMIRVGDGPGYTGKQISSKEETRMQEIEPLRVKLVRWVESCWLLVSNPTFQHARNKRQAYYDYRLSKIYMRCF